MQPTPKGRSAHFSAFPAGLANRRAAMIAGFAAVVVLAAAFAAWQRFAPAPDHRSHPVIAAAAATTAVPVPDVALVHHSGAPARLADYQGRPLVIYFGYTMCPDVCPMSLSLMVQAHRLLGEEADKVRFAFVTIDPERDTPERLAFYIPYFDPSFTGFTGTPENLRPLYDTFGVRFEKVNNAESAAGYAMAHTSSTYLVDASGAYRTALPHDTTAAAIVSNVRALLAEPRK